MEEEIRLCPNCRRPVTGRADKRFCSDACRTMYNNRIYRRRYTELTRIDRILKKNHSIIERIYENGKRQTTFTELFGMGFNFNYLTSLRENPDTAGSFIAGCYDYTYVIADDGSILIDRKKAIPL